MTTWSFLLGLQREFLAHLDRISTGSNKTDEFLKIFDQQATNIQRINLIYPYLNEFNMLDDKFKPDDKNDAKANQHKIEATKYFCPGQYNKALQLCTRMIMNARSKEVLAVGFANRSAALFKLELYKECLTDIDRAIAYGYSEKLMPQLMIRKTKSEELLKCQAVLTHCEDLPTIPEHHRNPIYSFASNSLDARLGKNRLYVVADRDIKVGDVLLVEPPTVATTGEAELYHCHFCFILCYNAIPCENCTQTLYCTKSCKEKAFIKYHKHECRILLSLNNFLGKNPKNTIPLRMLFYATPDEFLRLFKVADSVGVKDFQKAKLGLTMIGAVVYDLVAKYTKMFEDFDKADDIFKDVVVSYLLFCMYQVTPIEETVFHSETHNGKTELLVSTERVGSAVYYFNTLFRHSCCPNVSKHHHGIALVMRAVKNIKKGEECVVSYGPLYSAESLKDRQESLLGRYGFKCTCRACEENWPQNGVASEAIQRCHISEVADYNLESIKRLIQKRIDKIKKFQKHEPHSELTQQIQKLMHYYALLANRRLIL